MSKLIRGSGSNDLDTLDTASTVFPVNGITDEMVEDILKLKCEGTSVEGARKYQDMIRDKFRDIDLTPTLSEGSER